MPDWRANAETLPQKSPAGQPAPGWHDPFLEDSSVHVENSAYMSKTNIFTGSMSKTSLSYGRKAVVRVEKHS
jgi:hypothetical protein